LSKKLKKKIKYIILKVNSITTVFGLDPIKFIQSFRGIWFFLISYLQLKKQMKNNVYPFKISGFHPILSDVFKTNGATSGHYFHQDLYVAQQIYSREPIVHFDVGSRIDGFVAHVASFREIKVVDVRMTNVNIPNMEFYQADFSRPLPPELIGVCDSVSCLHALEHFGLGRYGDAVNINGYETGFENLINMLTKGGILYLSVPVGPQRIEFNAHRVFDVKTICNMTERIGGDIKSFSYVDDIGNFHKDIDLKKDVDNSNFGCSYGCGIFEIVSNRI
jgi:hypothetical protein